MKFNEFVNEQVSRLEAIPGFQMGDAGRKELAGWLMAQAKALEGHLTGRFDCAADWLRIGGARNIKAVIDECVEFTSAPGLADIKAVWYRLYPPVSSHHRCEACGGTGWRIVERNGAEGVLRCDRKESVPV